MKPIPCLLFCLILLSLTACQSALVTDLATAPGEALFWDDFSQPSGNWLVSRTEAGAYAFLDGAYLISVVPPAYQMWALSGHEYRDVQVEADATLRAGPPANLYGLVCRAVDEQHFYFFAISSDGYFAVGKVSEGSTSLLGQEMMAYNAAILTGESLNHLRFDCTGSALSGFINGQLVALTEDEDYTHGDAGLIAGTFDEGGVEIQFDDFVVRKP